MDLKMFLIFDSNHHGSGCGSDRGHRGRKCCKRSWRGPCLFFIFWKQKLLIKSFWKSNENENQKTYFISMHKLTTNLT